jgi:hypothetical protein
MAEPPARFVQHLPQRQFDRFEQCQPALRHGLRQGLEQQVLAGI